MVGRFWTATANRDNAKRYVRFFEREVMPQLAKIDGNRGALVMNRSDGGRVEITVLTFWDSMAAVEKFAGADVQVAIIEDEAKSLLERYDDRVKHYDLAINALSF